MTNPRSSEKLADVETWPLMSLGSSNDAIYRMVRSAVSNRLAGGGLLIDVGCGNGQLWPYLRDRFDRYVGLDAQRHSEFPSRNEFHKLDFDRDSVDAFADTADVGAAVEVVEHLENPLYDR